MVGIDLQAASIDVAMAAPRRSIRAGHGAVTFQENLGGSLDRRGQAP
jgi:hypothetical protein